MKVWSAMSWRTFQHTISVAACAVLFVVAAACSDESGNDDSGENNSGGGSTGVVKFAEIEVVPDKVSVSQAISPGAESVHIVQVRNTGEIDLEIDKVLFEYTPVSADETDGKAAFRLAAVRGCTSSGCADSWDPATTDLTALGKPSPLTIGVDGIPYSYLEMEVRFLRPETTAQRNAKLILESNANGQPAKVITFSTLTGNASIVVLPPDVDFDQVKSGEEPIKKVTITNVGSDKLEVSKMVFNGSNYFSLLVGDKSYAPGDTIEFDPPIGIEQGAQWPFDVQFKPTDADPATATINIFSNDINAPVDGSKVTLKGNTKGPCIAVNPKTLNFGGKVIGQLSTLPVEIVSCGTAPLEITSIDLEEGSSPDFVLDFTSIPGFEDNTPPSLEKPLIMAKDTKVELTVRFVPDGENPKDELGAPIPDVGTILLTNNTFEEVVPVKVQGIGVDVNCPQAVIVVQEGDQVIPQTVLHLFGDQSSSPAGDIVSWLWSVQQPAGSQSLFLPSNTFPTVTFEANVAGSYLFSLDVTDSNGTTSCFPGSAAVVVIPDEAIHVELVWNTPEDPNQTDEGPEAGADLDLHFLHPFAAGPDLDGDQLPDGWFDNPFDCFWFNPNPQWGAFDPAIDDDPSLDRDDTDGAGPENLNLNIPEANKVYRVGVHYWHDHGFGPSFATVYVYIYGERVFEVADVKLVNHDMWSVATISWPDGAVKQIEGSNGSYKITPKYENPFFFQP